MPRALSADFARLRLKVDETARENDAALEEARQKMELLLQEREESNGVARAEAALRQRAEDEAALAGARYESLREHSERQLAAAQREAKEDADGFRATYEALSEHVRREVAAARRNAEEDAERFRTAYGSLRERLQSELAAAQQKAREDAERAQERYESLCEQMTATAAAAAVSEAAVAAAEAAATESAREAAAEKERMGEMLRAGKENAEDEVRRATAKVSVGHQLALMLPSTYRWNHDSKSGKYGSREGNL